ncbi:MAG: ABC-F family ATP-binding cassette domain-containing protein [Flavipsychrobacter sp.]|nr:ABC-F family ATP-binding cassette domain-containing protein [Flavipsychrobacter sp.]
MLSTRNLSYTHPNGDTLFTNLELNIQAQQKLALIGNNGSGKSTLLKILSGCLQPVSGSIVCDDAPYYVPQHFGQFHTLTVTDALLIADKLIALHQILNGEVTENNMTPLNDDWSIEERSQDALAEWGLHDINLQQPMASLSGGQKTRVLLAGIRIHEPGIILLDEPTNHLDNAGRQQLYDYIDASNKTLIVVTHDRALLNLLQPIYELSPKGITVYGGDYAFYKEQKTIEATALAEDLRSTEKALRKARETERETIERQQKLDARGRKKQDKSGMPTIMMNTMRNNAERSTAKARDIHAEKTQGITQQLNDLRKELPEKDKMKIGFSNANLHSGKILVTATELNAAYDGTAVWATSQSLQVISGERICLAGGNGSGKTTLAKLLLGVLQPSSGNIYRADFQSIYIDQDYALVDDSLTLYEQAQRYNTAHLEAHEVKSKLTHFLFASVHWDKMCGTLSGGEKMRLILCCLTLGKTAPDLIVLDEPTNNLDLQNMELLTNALRAYRGTLIVISHDRHFLQELQISRTINVNFEAC